MDLPSLPLLCLITRTSYCNCSQTIKRKPSTSRFQRRTDSYLEVLNLKHGVSLNRSSLSYTRLVSSSILRYSKADVFAAPERLLIASDWPNTRYVGEIDNDAWLQMVLKWCEELDGQRAVERVFKDNAEKLWGFEKA